MAAKEARSVSKRRSKRKSARSYGDVTRTEIGSAALKVIEKHGLEGLSMRRVADELNLSTMAAYYYVSNKDELLEVALDCALQKMPAIPKRPGRFSERYAGTFPKTLAAWRKYPGLYLVAVKRMDSPLMVTQIERMRADLVQEGLAPPQVDSVLFHMASHFFGMSTLDSTVDEASRPEFERRVDESITMLISGIEALIETYKKKQK